MRADEKERQAPPRKSLELGHEFEEIVVDTRPLAVVLLSRSVRPFILILGLAALITLLGSAFPLRRASRYDPAPILRGE